MTFNTGNPIGSTDARDRSDNSENLDLAVNSLSQTFVDRLGRTRDTLEGIYKKSAYYRAGTFAAGYTLTNNRQTLAYGNVEYSWSGAFPKVVAAGSTPATSGGIGAGAWVDRTDETLRSNLAAETGFGLIGAINSISALRLITPTHAGHRVLVTQYYEALPARGGGVFIYDESDSTSTDDGGMVIVSIDGSRWKRSHGNQSSVLAEWFGVISGVDDITININHATQYALINKTGLVLPTGRLNLKGNWLIDNDDFSCFGHGIGQTVIYLHPDGNGQAGLTAKKTGWDSNTDYPGPRIRNLQLNNFSMWGSIENVSGTQSSRDAFDLRGCGFDFDIGNVWFYNIGRRAIVAEDLWDGDIHHCKFHEIGTDPLWTPSDCQPHAIALKRKVDSCNAIRFSSNHFEHCKRGALNIADLCYSIFLINNKFESINAESGFPDEYPIYIGDNHRNFVMIGGFAVLNQKNKNVHFLRCFGDNSKIFGVEFIGSGVVDGAAVMDLNYGSFGVGPVVSCHMDVDGSQTQYPIIIRNGRSNFNGSTIKINNPGKCFDFGGSGNIADYVSITGVGTPQSSGYIFNQENPTNNIGRAKFFGIAPSEGYITNQSSKYEVGDVIMAVNKSYTTSLSSGAVIDSTAIRPSNALGVEDSSAVIVGNWMCLGNAPAYVDGMAANSVSMFKRI